MKFDRYVRQMRFAPLGEEGQKKLSASRALVCGCGALGSVIANTLVRAGVGHVRLVDRDFLELNNLQRQVLYDEDDVAAGLPKAIAAQNRLRRINSEVDVEAIVADVDHANIESFLHDVQVMVDGTDNFETRFLLNDASLHFGVPWIYGGCIGGEGQTMSILPGQTACLRCLMHDAPPPGSTPTCDSAGILAPVINVIGSLEAMEALKILAGRPEAVNRTLTIVDVWENTLRQVKLASLRAVGDCPACNLREFPWLRGERGSHTAILCGRNAVQLSFPGHERLSLDALAERLQPLASVARNKFLLRAEIEGYQLTIFPDGRAIIGGTEDLALARSLYTKYIGN
jgi:molybdopterin-synthase adenylyltransferase